MKDGDVRFGLAPRIMDRQSTSTVNGSCLAEMGRPSTALDPFHGRRRRILLLGSSAHGRLVVTSFHQWYVVLMRMGIAMALPFES
jgi:hypothetical protein